MKEMVWQDIPASLATGIFIGVGLFAALPHSASMFGWREALLLGIFGGVTWWLMKMVLFEMNKPEMPPLVASALWLHAAAAGFVTGIMFGVSQVIGIAVLIGMILSVIPAKRSATVVPLIGYGIFLVTFYLTYHSLFTMRLWMPTFIAVSAGALIYEGVRSLWLRWV